MTAEEITRLWDEAQAEWPHGACVGTVEVFARKVSQHTLKEASKHCDETCEAKDCYCPENIMDLAMMEKK